ncbi:ankyrin repeat domain protein [Wolbachia endosymbiont wPip_Mol of Culex molestus]|uniref:ankyrin repeat domain-containing protein n=1 Tax=Wolbachia endosymbiont of Culex molestus TaxID=329647 RepID=UPI0003B098C1|nr:ankyrin repeat domain-containing protein [Wolbachia endosymbiont of Culex molestus]CQD08614.1 ankyrin repeat domain protein [Wolbachia endosymbiont wPip_Mol of Culex molestus]
MIGEYESLGKVLRTIEVKEGLNKDNIIEEIKTELEKQDQGLYKNWEEGKFDVNYVFPLFFCECTLLTIAAENGHASVVEVLLKAEANVNAVDSNKWFTPLHVAAENGHASVVEVLLKAKANVNAVGIEGCTPLHVAAENGHASVVEVLLKAEANVNAVGIEGCTPLHFAAGNGHVDIVNLLLEKGANVNAVDRYGKTPLDYAEGYAKNQDVVKALLDARGGSFVKARNKAMIAGGVNTLLGTAIAVALFTTGTITAQLIPIVIAVVAVTAAALVVGCATYELLKPSTKVDGAEKPIVNSINEQQRVTSISSY